MSELDEVTGRMGNEIMSLIGTTRNLSLDYQKLIDVLARLSQPQPGQSPQQQAKQKEPMGMRDRVIMTVRDKEGNVKQEYDSGWSPNGITNAGFASVAGLILTDVGDTPYDYCVPPGTMVYTNPGFKQIEEVLAGELVGDGSEVLATSKRNYQGTIVEAKPRYLVPVSFTPEHRILVVERVKKNLYLGGGHSNPKRKKTWVLSKPVWKMASEVKPLRDCVVVPKSVFKEESEIIIDLSPYQKKGNSKQKLRDRVELTEDFAELCGWYVAEGSIGGRKKSPEAQFTLGKDEEENIEKVRTLIKKLGYLPQVIEGDGGVTIKLRAPVLARLLADKCGKGAENKRIPDFIMKAPRRIKEAFLRGYANGDGNPVTHPHVGRGWVVTTVSKELAMQLQMLLLSMGIVSDIVEGKREGMVTIKGRETWQRNNWIVTWLDERKRKLYHEDENNYYFPVSRVNIKPFEGEVYNLETESNIYLLPFVVHNCAIGTGTTAFDPTQTALVTEIKRKAGTGTRVTTSVTNDTAQLVTTFSSADGLTGTSSVTEVGMFNASTGGTMLARQTFSSLSINWDSGDTLQVTWRVQVKQAT